MVASAFFFAGMGVAVKAAAQTLPNSMVVFFRSAGGLLFLLPWVARLGFRNLGTRHLPEHLVRSLAGLAAMYCFFYTIAHMPLADAVLLNYSLPLFLPFIGNLWLGEAIPAGLWPGLILGFLGIVLILKPGLDLFNPVALVGVAAAVLAAVAQTGIRRLTHTEPTTRIVLYFSVVSTVVSGIPLLHSWKRPDPAMWGVLVALGLLATFGQLFLTKAYAQAPAAQVGPFIYTAVVFAAAFDAFIWGKWPDALSMGGSILVCAAGILTLRRIAPPPSALAELVE